MLTLSGSRPWNKNIVTNGLCLSLVGIGYFSPVGREQILSMGYFGLSGAITNWLAIHMLFEKVPGLYGSGIIPNKFAEFKRGIERLIMQEFFTEENLEKFIDEQFESGHKGEAGLDLAPLMETLDYDLLFHKLIEMIEETPIAPMLQMFGGAKAMDPLKEPFREKIGGVIYEMVQQDEFRDRLQALLRQQMDAQSMLRQIDQIVKQRLEELTPQMVKEIIQDMIRQHLGWLVVWGGVFGALLGLVASFLV